MKKLFYIFMFAMLVPSIASAQQQAYELVDLGTPSGYIHSWAVDINNNGTVLYKTEQGSGIPFVWNEGVTQGLATSGGACYALNDRELIVGGPGPGPVRYSAFSITAGSGPYFFPFTQDGYGSYMQSAYDVNNSGVVVGFSGGFNFTHALLFDGSMSDLGTLGGNSSVARGINNLNQVVGFAATANNQSHACLWANGIPQDLCPFSGNSDAYAINNLGTVVGISDGHAFIWNGAPSELSGLQGETGYPYSINDVGDVVGQSRGRAVLWHNGVVADLNNLIPSGSSYVLNTAKAINNNGWIAASADVGGVSRAVVLKPVQATLATKSTWGALKAKYR